MKPESKCYFCGELFEKWDKQYRCVDCDQPFHRHCLRKHFLESKDQWVAAVLDALDDGNISKAKLILREHTTKRDCIITW